MILGTRYTNTSFFMLFITFITIGTLLAGLLVAMTRQSPKARFDLIMAPTAAPTIPPLVINTTTATTTIAATTTSTTTTTPATTTPTAPVNITCPPNVTVVLGAPFDPANTGGYAIGGGGCSFPVIQWVDSNVGLIAKREKEMEEMTPKWYHQHDSEVMPSELGDENMMPALLDDMNVDEHGMLNVHGAHAEGYEVVNPREGASIPGTRIVGKTMMVPHLKRTASRSATFNNNHLLITGTPLSVSNTGAVPPDSTAAVSNTHVVMAVNAAPQGSLVTITDKMTAFQSSFYMSSLGTGNCSGSTRGDPQVLWDHEAERWLLLELGTANVLCVYLSDTSDPQGPYSSWIYDFDPYFPDFPKLGLWRQAYLLTFNMQPQFPGDTPKDMCVIDRTHMLNFIMTANVTAAPYMLCAASYDGRLSGFGFQAWTPISAEGGPMPPQLTESANSLGVGAVFFRHYDDELHGTMSPTPTVDYIDIEHWSNVNFTANTFSAQRYRRTVADFDSSFSGCASSDDCIPTPTAQQLDPVREVINHRIQYRYIPAMNQESVVMTWTSHANGTATARVRWAEFRWTTPLVTQPKSWRLHQEGAVPFDDGVHRWMGAISMDATGTIALGYSESSSTLYPSLSVRYRLGNDPLNQLREPLLINAGAMGSVIPSNRWGDYASMSTDPTQSRVFYVTGQVADDTHPWVVHLVRLRVQGETVERFWRADDLCGGFANCTQTITAI